MNDCTLIIKLKETTNDLKSARQRLIAKMTSFETDINALFPDETDTMLSTLYEVNADETVVSEILSQLDTHSDVEYAHIVAERKTTKISKD